MDIFTSDFKETPYWWDAAAPEPHAETVVPRHVDVAVIGSGYTGLHAAIQTARAGKSTIIIEAEVAGYGASTRNGGQISNSIKDSYPQLAKKYGPALAAEILGEGQTSLGFIKQFIADEKIDCDLQTVGRFHGAHTPGNYEKLSREIDINSEVYSDDAFLVTPSEQKLSIGTDVYHGGIVFPHHASLHPAKYHKGLLRIARQAGVQIVTNCPVLDLKRETNGFCVVTPKGQLIAKRIVLATNGYTGSLSPWQQRRIIPIGSYMMATEELPESVMARVMPTNRIISDSRKLVYYYRPSPDRKRILFGGRVSLRETDAKQTGPKLRSELIRLFPELAEVKISHSWSGFVGYTFDTLMHAGNDDGLFYAMGYCGSGVGMASYLGMRIGQQAADNPMGQTAFNKIPFPTRPFYSGNPWFLAPSIMAYRVRDRFGI